MAKTGPAAIIRPIRWDRLRTDEAEREIRRRLVMGSPFVSNHAFDRVAERQEQGVLTEVDMMTILETGSISSPPERAPDGWKVIVQKRMPGCREAGVVTLIVVPGDDLEVITVEWMDWR